MEDDMQIMEYYLPREDGVEKLAMAYDTPIDLEKYNEVREMTQVDGNDPKIDELLPVRDYCLPADGENALYDRIRTYEVVAQSKPSKEILVSFSEASDGETPSKRRKGVSYKEITMRTLLRKTRAKVRCFLDLLTPASGRCGYPS
jgi:hypothetical protein